MTTTINELDKLEILTLQDNYVDLLAGDSSEILQRAIRFKRRPEPFRDWSPGVVFWQSTASLH